MRRRKRKPCARCKTPILVLKEKRHLPWLCGVCAALRLKETAQRLSTDDPEEVERCESETS
jgi:ribosomal protein S27AE